MTMASDVEQTIIVDATEAAPSDDGNPLFQCAMCYRRFGRVDHLSRHIRTHTKEKPHQCSTCDRSFARADLLLRHCQLHKTQDGSQEPTGLRDGRRAARACRPCVLAKVKCDDLKPCQRCTKRGLPCSATSSAANLKAPASIPGTYISSSDGEETVALVEPSPLSPVSELLQLTEEERLVSIGGRLESDAHGGMFPSNCYRGGQDVPGDGIELALAPSAAAQRTSYSGFLRDMLLDSPMHGDSSILPTLGQSSNRPVQFDLLHPPSSWYQQDILQDSLINVPFDEFDLISTTCDLPDFYLPQAGRASISQSPEQAVQAAGNTAFMISVWHWVPTTADGQYTSQQDLTLPADAFSARDEALMLSPEILSKRLSPADRERMLSVLLSHCELSHVVRIASSFPSHQLMERLFHTALHFQTIGTLSWLHVSTFSPALASDELVAALVAYGAFLSPVSVVQNLGMAISDILFVSVPCRWGKNNATTRDLETWQSWAVILHLMFWSGSKRKMEIAESHLQPLITMLRRSGVLSSGHYSVTAPTAEDTPSELETKWQAWAQSESKIRLVHHLFIHDAQVSMTKFVNPLLSAAELTLPLPCPEALWSAGTANDWRARYLDSTKAAMNSTSLARRVRESFQHVLHQSAPTSDDALAANTLVLYGFWTLVWDCQLLGSWLKSDNGVHGQSEDLTHLRSTMLSRALNQFCLDSEVNAAHSYTTKQIQHELVLNYLLLALYTPVRSLPVFAGSGGNREAESVLLTLQEWAHGRDGRKALGYAGQIYRYTRLLHQSLRQAFFGVVVYHASLSFWAYGTITGARTKFHGPSSDPLRFPTAFDHEVPVIFLDGTLSPQFARFIATGEGKIIISTAPNADDTRSEEIHVDHRPGALMEAGKAILEAQAKYFDGRLPRFVENLLQLMDGLSKAVKSVGFG